MSLNSNKKPVKLVYTIDSSSSGVIVPDGGGSVVNQAGSNVMRIAAGGPDFGGATVTIAEWLGGDVPRDDSGDYWIPAITINANSVADLGKRWDIGRLQPFVVSVAGATGSTDVKLNIWF